jgi:hypothetical protein
MLDICGACSVAVLICVCLPLAVILALRGLRDDDYGDYGDDVLEVG